MLKFSLSQTVNVTVEESGLTCERRDVKTSPAACNALANPNVGQVAVD